MALTTQASAPEGFSFAVKDSSGILVAADETPAAVLKRIYTSAGVRTIDESAAVVTVAAQATDGLYFATWTNGAWATDDQLQLFVTAIVGSVEYTACVAAYEIGGSGDATEAKQDQIIDQLTGVDLWTKRNAVMLSGLVTGAGTSTEVFTVSALSITATVTADADGNRSAVVWS